nr:MAG TPA: hypothetical protein [Caudoviricetes sp.]
MKKVVRTSLNNVANKRGVRDLNIQLYSHDKNNAGFEFVIKNEVDLSEYKAKVLFDFQESFATWETKGIVEGNIVKVKFDTTFITKCEEVIGYLFLDSETDTLDVFKFKFNVVLSEIDKYDMAKRGFRYIKDQEVVDVITRSELQEELAKLQVNAGVDLNNYLTTSVASETYAKKTDLPAPYNDSALVERVTNLENKTPVDLSNYALKTEIPQPYNDSELVQKIGQLEARVDKDTVYDDTPLKQRVEALETKVDKDTIYNDEEVKQRLTVLENKPAVDTSHFITDETLDSKNYLTTTVAEETYAKKSEIPQAYNDSALVERVTTLENRPTTGGSVDTTNFVTKEELADATPATLYEIYRTDTLKETLDEHVSFINPRNVARDAGKIYLNPSSLVPKVFKGDIGNEKTVDLDVVMYSVANSLPDGYTLSDVENDINNKVLFLSNKNFSEVVPKEELKSIVREVVGTGSTIDTSHFITEEILESKAFLTTHQDISNLATREELDKRVTREELEEKHYVTNEQISSTYATKSEIPQPYSDTELVKRITVLENRQDNDTVYDDAELKRRVTALEEKPNVDTSNFVTTSILESKGFLTQHQDLSEYAKKSELYNDTPLRTLVDNLEHDVLNGDSKVKLLENRVWELENKLREHDGIDLVYATKNELTNKENEFNFKFVLKDDLRRLVSEIVTELKSENN